jgi:hypothetical protein
MDPERVLASKSVRQALVIFAGLVSSQHCASQKVLGLSYGSVNYPAGKLLFPEFYI